MEKPGISLIQKVAYSSLATASVRCCRPSSITSNVPVYENRRCVGLPNGSPGTHATWASFRKKFANANGVDKGSPWKRRPRS